MKTGRDESGLVFHSLPYLKPAVTLSHSNTSVYVDSKVPIVFIVSSNNLPENSQDETCISVESDRITVMGDLESSMEFVGKKHELVSLTD